jgi:hypothetical protein
MFLEIEMNWPNDYINKVICGEVKEPNQTTLCLDCLETQ